MTEQYSDTTDFRIAVANEANKLYGCTAIPADKPSLLMIGYVVYKEIDGKEITAYPTKRLGDFSSFAADVFHHELLALIKVGVDEVNSQIEALS